MHLEQEEHVSLQAMPLVEMHVTNWAKAQREDLNVECSVGLAEGTEADKSKDTSGRTHLQ